MMIQILPRHEVCYKDRWYKAGDVLEVNDDFDADEKIYIKLKEAEDGSLDK